MQTFLILSLATAALVFALLWWRERVRNQRLARDADAWTYLEYSPEALAALLAAEPGEPINSAARHAQVAQQRVRARLSRSRHTFDPASVRETRLLSLSRNGAHYLLDNLCLGRLDLEALQAAGRLLDVGPLGGPPQFAALVARDSLRNFLLPETHAWALPTARWLSRLPGEADMVLVHLLYETSAPALHVVSADET
ncbi:hypothetical protein [Niveibacterium sp. SC-1]|uniref:hypothetical protein n=1 Tax=Niveibacterium sp. SC-1 TaxID=3135646 RepID=UPI00311D5634